MEEPSNPWSVVHFSIIRGGTLLSYNLQVIMVINVFDAFSRQVYNKNTKKRHTHIHSRDKRSIGHNVLCIMY